MKIEGLPIKSRLDLQIDEGVGLLQKLRELEGQKKLSRDAFVEAACEVAGVSLQRLRKFEARIEAKIGCDSLRSFVNRCSREFANPTFPTPPGIAKVDRVVRVYGTDPVAGELANANISAAQLVAIAAARCAERFPESFGSVRNWDQHVIRQEQLRSALKTLTEAMLYSWGAADIVVRRASDDTQIIVFKRSVDLNPNMSDWPAMLIQRVLEQRERRLAERAEAKAATKSKPSRKKRKRDREAARVSA